MKPICFKQFTGEVFCKLFHRAEGVKKPLHFMAEIQDTSKMNIF